KDFLWESLSGLLTRHRPPPPAQPNDPLIGAAARVVDDGSTSGMMRVRVGMETWRARTAAPSRPLPGGTDVEIRAADGPVLEAAARPAEAQQSTQPAP